MDEDYASLDISLNSFAQTRMDISTEEVPASQSESVSMLAQNTQTGIVPYILCFNHP